MLQLKLSIEADKNNLQYIDQVAMSALKERAEKKASKVHFALHEIVINSMQAFERIGACSNNLLEISLAITETVIEVQVKDYFGGFDKEEGFKISVEEADLFKPSGRGMLLINHLVDEFWWKSDTDGGFIVAFKVKNNQV